MPDTRLFHLAKHSIPELLDVVHRVYDDDRVSGCACDGGEESRAGS
jgi:hypothetical protein